MYKLEIAFVQGTSLVSKAISFVSGKFVKNIYKGNFRPSHVFLVLNDNIVFESSTYKKAGTDNEKILEKGTRLLTINDIAKQKSKQLIARTLLTNDLDPYLALTFVAKASNYKYSYKSIVSFLTKGRFKHIKNIKPKNEYICSGLVLDALREDYFKNNRSIQKVVKQFDGIDSNTVTPLDLFLALANAGFEFKTCKGLSNNVSNL